MHSYSVAVSNPFYQLILGQAVPCFIMLSGYVYTMAECSKENIKIYRIGTMFRRFCRYTIPILVTYVGWLMIRIAGVFFFGEERLSLKHVLLTFLWGEYGPGAYYYWVMVSFLLVFPIIKWLIFKFSIHGLFLVGIVNFFYCLACEYYQFNKHINNLVFRFLLLMGMGVYLYKVKNEEISNECLFKMMMIGISYLLLPLYWNYEYRIFTYLPGDSMMVSFWVFPIMYMVLKNVGNICCKNKFVNLFKLIGRASYHIMCVQILVFNIQRKFFQYIGMKDSSASVKCVVEILMSLVGGIVFFYVDNKIFGRFYRKTQKELAKREMVKER